MTTYLFKRFLSFIPTLIGVSLVVFFAIRLIPGDAIIATLGTEAGMLTETQRIALKKYYGLDKPAIQQYFIWGAGTLTGNLGFSVRHGKPVTQLIRERFPLTLELTILAVIISLLIGIPIGLLSAIHQNSFIDILGRLFSLIGLALPNFLIATLIIYVLSVYFHILPTSGDYASF
ncbi:MAG TPA: ABC transporter permease, partial [Trueperaceae bacterium]|nr:ABC transporter permease [Trueperaceae bacterium]